MTIFMKGIEWFDPDGRQIVHRIPQELGRHEGERPARRPGEPGGRLLPRRQGPGCVRSGAVERSGGWSRM